MKTTLIALIALLLAACSAAPYQRAPIAEDVTYKPWKEWEAIESVRFPAQASGPISSCVAESVTSYGSQVIAHADSNKVIAHGLTHFPVTQYVQHAMRFTLAATPEQYTFTNIEQGMQNSAIGIGAMFYPVGAWQDGNADQAIAALKQIAASIDRCRSR
tara:strand:- start:11739 stop:12215 length:477 start_codon:yes stop_codon:yes gene_type:complete